MTTNALINSHEYPIRPDNTLPHELFLSIQRILESQPNPRSEPFGAFAGELDSVEALNTYFPDGMRSWSFEYISSFNDACRGCSWSTR